MTTFCIAFYQSYLFTISIYVGFPMSRLASMAAGKNIWENAGKGRATTHPNGKLDDEGCEASRARICKRLTRSPGIDSWAPYKYGLGHPERMFRVKFEKLFLMFLSVFFSFAATVGNEWQNLLIFFVYFPNVKSCGSEKWDQNSSWDGVFKFFRNPGIDSASLCSLSGRFLVPHRLF